MSAQLGGPGIGVLGFGRLQHAVEELFDGGLGGGLGGCHSLLAVAAASVASPTRVWTGDAYTWHSNLLLTRPPQAMPALARAWGRAAPLLGELREPFTTHVWSAGALDRFEEFDDMVRGWGEVVTEAARRGWGLVGLPE